MAVGVTVIVAPVPSDVPVVHEPEYQFQVAPVPRIPPVIESTEVFPEHTDDGLEMAVVTEVDKVLRTTSAVSQVVLPQVPSALT